MPTAGNEAARLRALFVEDNPDDAELLTLRLEREGYRVEGERVDSEPALRQALTGPEWDVVFADFQVPGLGALESIAVLRELAPDTPCIVVSGAVGEEVAVEAMRAGARDFLVKGRWARLAPAVQREVAEARMRRSLRASELRFDSVVESMGEGLVITDLDDVILYVNPRLAALTGRQAGELLGAVSHRTLMPREQWEVQKERTRNRARGLSEEYETEIVDKSGERRWVRVTAAPSRDAHGRVVGSVATLADVTERHRAMDRVRALNAELQANAAAYRDLANFGARIEQIHDIDALIDAGLEDLVRQLGLDLGEFFVIRDGACHVARTWGQVPAELARLFETPIPVGLGLVGTVAASGEAQLVEDYARWPGALPEYVALGVRTRLTIPVKRGGRSIGVINLVSFERIVDIDDESHTVARGFVRRLENALERVDYILELTTTREQTFRALGVALEYRDYETKGHTDRVVAQAVGFGRAVGMSDGELQALQWGAYLHDLGKIAIPDDILLKPGKLTVEEFEVIKRHTVYGYEMTRGIPFLPDSTRALVRSHHEAWNGRGYPDGLAGDAIPLMARMFSLVDVYDALLSDRPYKRAWTHGDAVAEIRGKSGEQFDPELAAVFLELVEERHRPA